MSNNLKPYQNTIYVLYKGYINTWTNIDFGQIGCEFHKDILKGLAEALVKQHLIERDWDIQELQFVITAHDRSVQVLVSKDVDAPIESYRTVHFDEVYNNTHVKYQRYFKVTRECLVKSKSNAHEITTETLLKELESWAQKQYHYVKNLRCDVCYGIDTDTFSCKLTTNYPGYAGFTLVKEGEICPLSVE